MRRANDPRAPARLLAAAAAGALLAGGCLPLGAQERSDPWPGPPPGTRTPIQVQGQVQGEGGDDGSLLGLAKWGTLAVSAGASVYGFHVNSRADEEYREIEEICNREPARCQSRAPDGSFTDPDLEARYQGVLDKDGNARTALIMAQVGLAATVVLFILDLDGGEDPPDIPFDPPRISVTPGGTEMTWTVELPFH